MKKKFFLLILIGAIGQLLMAGDWRTRYGRDAFGDEDPSRVVYTVNLSGTTNIVRPNENCILGVMAYPYNGYAVIKVFLHRYSGDFSAFFSNSTAYFKLSDGSKLSVSCQVDDNGDLWLGTNRTEIITVEKIFNNGNFTLSIQSSNDFGDRMTCLFRVGAQTTGIKGLVNQ